MASHPGDGVSDGQVTGQGTVRLLCTAHTKAPLTMSMVSEHASFRSKRASCYQLSPMILYVTGTAMLCALSPSEQAWDPTGPPLGAVQPSAHFPIRRLVAALLRRLKSTAQTLPSTEAGVLADGARVLKCLILETLW